MEIRFQDQFWHDSTIPESRVFERFPSIYKDGRGSFSEVLKNNVFPENQAWYEDLSWIKQVNRSVSKPGVARGLHAQSGKFCQGKLVQAVRGRIFDVIVDARPDSATFGAFDMFQLNPETQNQIWVPRGFLHGFVVPADQGGDAIFEYFCDNVYNKPSEVGIAPRGILPDILKAKDENNPEFRIDSFELSEKDVGGLDYGDWMLTVKMEYEKEGTVWYR